MPFQIDAKAQGGQKWNLVVSLAGPTLLDLLKEKDVPIRSSCSGKGICSKCRVRVISGLAPESPADKKIFSTSELLNGWRLSCTLRPKSRMGISIPSTYKISSVFTKKRDAKSDWWLACDLGTTGIELSAVDSDGVWGHFSELNHQVKKGDDVMTRLDQALNGERLNLQKIIISQLEKAISQFLVSSTSFSFIDEVVVAGNSAMVTLLAGMDVEQLAVYPYQPEVLEEKVVKTSVGLLKTLPLIHSFVGGDTFACLFSLWKNRIKVEGESPWILIDIGTNSEICYWTGEQLFVGSTPAGPAFEGSNISIGMRAENGAIVSPVYNKSTATWSFSTIGEDLPVGVCGSGLIDVIAESVKNELISDDGELLTGDLLDLKEGLGLNRDDIREFQLAKSAVKTGLEMILEKKKLAGVGLVVAGNFGYHLNFENCIKIGMFPSMGAKAVGNLSLKGVIEWQTSHMDLQNEFKTWLKQSLVPVELALEDRFQELFVRNLKLDKE